MAFVATGGLILACIVLNCVALKTQGSRRSRKDVYGNTWVVFVEREKRFVDDLAKRNGFINRGEIEGFSGHYLLEHKILPKRRLRRDATDHTDKLLREPHVKFALQQKILRRTKRGYFVDPYYKDQWYLNNSGKYTSRRNHPIQIEECTSLRMLAVFLVCISLRSSWLVNYIGIDLQFLALNERQEFISFFRYQIFQLLPCICANFMFCRSYAAACKFSYIAYAYFRFNHPLIYLLQGGLLTH